MERLIPLALICGAVTVVMVWLLLARVRRQLETGLELVPVQRRSVVLVLRTQEELGEAVSVRRASSGGPPMKGDQEPIATRQ